MNPLRLRFIQTCLLRGSPVPPTPGARGTESVGADPIAAVQGRESAGLRYLDIGCGGGILAEALARLKSTRSVVGVDASRGVLEVAEAHRRMDPGLVRGGRLRYENCVVEELGGRLKGEERGGFDVVGFSFPVLFFFFFWWVVGRVRGCGGMGEREGEREGNDCPAAFFHFGQ